MYKLPPIHGNIVVHQHMPGWVVVTWDMVRNAQWYEQMTDAATIIETDGRISQPQNIHDRECSVIVRACRENLRGPWTQIRIQSNSDNEYHVSSVAIYDPSVDHITNKPKSHNIRQAPGIGHVYQKSFDVYFHVADELIGKYVRIRIIGDDDPINHEFVTTETLDEGIISADFFRIRIKDYDISLFQKVTVRSEVRVSDSWIEFPDVQVIIPSPISDGIDVYPTRTNQVSISWPFRKKKSMDQWSFAIFKDDNETRQWSHQKGDRCVVARLDPGQQYFIEATMKDILHRTTVVTPGTLLS